MYECTSMVAMLQNTGYTGIAHVLTAHGIGMGYIRLWILYSPVFVGWCGGVVVCISTYLIHGCDNNATMVARTVAQNVFSCAVVYHHAVIYSYCTIMQRRKDARRKDVKNHVYHSLSRL